MTTRILIVEDDTHALSGLIEILTDEGYEVTGVTGVDTALSELQRQRFNILLTDVRLAGQDGLALCKQVATVFPGLPTMVMSAYDMASHKTNPGLEHIRHWFVKPLNINALCCCIKNLVQHGGRQRPLAAFCRQGDQVHHPMDYKKVKIEKTDTWKGVIA